MKKVKILSSHQLARKLLAMPDLPVSSHEHGEKLSKVEVDNISTNDSCASGVPEPCISLIFN